MNENEFQNRKSGPAWQLIAFILFLIVMGWSFWKWDEMTGIKPMKKVSKERIDPCDQNFGPDYEVRFYQGKYIVCRNEIDGHSFLFITTTNYIYFLPSKAISPTAFEDSCTAKRVLQNYINERN